MASGKRSRLGANRAMHGFAFGMFAYHAAQLLQVFFAQDAFLKELGALAAAVFLCRNAGAHILLQGVFWRFMTGSRRIDGLYGALRMSGNTDAHRQRTSDSGHVPQQVRAPVRVNTAIERKQQAERRWQTGVQSLQRMELLNVAHGLYCFY